MNKPKILVIDDEEDIHFALNRSLGRDYDLLKALDAETGLEIAEAATPDLVITDIQLPGISGIEALNTLKSEYPNLSVIVMTAHSTTSRTIESTKLGAYEYFIKPPDTHELRGAINRALKDAEHQKKTKEVQTDSSDALIGSSEAMQNIRKLIGKMAGRMSMPIEAFDANGVKYEKYPIILITGETGAGKELVARLLHQHSNRSHRKIIVVNVAAVPANIFESELFGHERGAFTGAEKARIGRFEEAQNGTLFLDEIGEIQNELQTKMLRVLDDWEFNRVGGNELIRINTQVIAATNKDLSKEVSEGRFRNDLYYRLKNLTIHVPPLRERREDIEELTNYFLDNLRKATGKSSLRISRGTMQTLKSYLWPGNVRELKNVLEGAAAQTDGEIASEDLALEADPAVSNALSADESLNSGINLLLDNPPTEGAHQYIDRILTLNALEKANGNQQEAARLLGVSRNTIASKLKKYGISKEIAIASAKRGA